MNNPASLARRAFALALFALAACNGATVTADGSTDTGSDVTTNADATLDTAFVCPGDPSTLDGQPCSTSGQTCGTCSDPCQFCNIARCDGTRWTHVEVFPGQCDGGAPDSQAIDAGGGVACGTMTCTGNQICVHSVSTGGACRMVEDGGCNPGERLAGNCCVAYSESFRCDLAPISCETAISCGCAASLCGEPSTGGCPCQSANGSTLECACYLP